jgi:hypothetical protein
MNHSLIRSACLLALLAGASTSYAADHKEAPLIADDPAADINDVYAFPNPADATRFVLAMTVNPLTDPEQNGNANFSPTVRYRFEIDFNNDGKSDRSIAVTFSPVANGAQTMTVDLPGRADDFTAPVQLGSSAPTAPAPVVTTSATGISAFAGVRDDPFFFDLAGFNRFRAGTGTFSGRDAFAGANCSILALEIPLQTLTGGLKQFQVYGATDRKRTTVVRSASGKLLASSGPWEQIERMGNPAIATVFIAKKNRDKFNIITPNKDAREFGAEISASIDALGTNAQNKAILASVAIPDTLKLNLDNAPGFPNGRRPQDDVIDTELFFIFNQPSPFTGDGVNANDKTFLDAFPYFAAPHQPQ